MDVNFLFDFWNNEMSVIQALAVTLAGPIGDKGLRTDQVRLLPSIPHNLLFTIGPYFDISVKRLLQVPPRLVRPLY